ncbi:unnamed protein product, partial [marine sediment metagenome]
MLPTFEQHLFVGVDASIKHDCAAVVAAYHDQEQGKVVLAKHRIWYPSPKEPLDLDGTIGDYLRYLHRNYSVQEIDFDPYQMHDLSTRLRSDG